MTSTRILPHEGGSEASAADSGQTDPVARFLATKGIAPETAYLGETEFELGKRVALGELEMVYRFEAGTLLICHVEARQGPAGLGGAVARLIELVHAIERAVPEVREVRGLVPVSGNCATLNALHTRLLAVYERQGAERAPVVVEEDDDGSMERVVYRMRQPGMPLNVAVAGA